MVTAGGVYMTDAEGKRMITGSDRGRFGERRSSWGVHCKRRAKRMERQGRESQAGDRERSASQVVFRMRFVRDLKVSDRLVDLSDGGQAYDIQDVIEVARGRWQDVICIRRTTPENANQGEEEL